MQIILLEEDFYPITTYLHDSQGEKSIFSVIADFMFNNYRPFLGYKCLQIFTSN